MKVRHHKITSLHLVVLGSSILAGCPQVHTYFDSYTRTKPNKQDLVGSYALTSQTLSEQPIANLRAKDGSIAAAHKLILMRDGSFSATGIPEWNKDKNDNWYVQKFLSSKGQWKLDSYILDKKADGVEGTIWSLAFKGTGSSLNGASLLGNKPPYLLVMEFDEDGDKAMEFERE